MGPNINDPVATAEDFLSVVKDDTTVPKEQYQTEYRSIIGTYGAPLKWFNIALLVTVHGIAVWTVFTLPYFESKRLLLWNIFVAYLAGVGLGGGAHRLWTHRAYKAKLPLRIIMMIWYCATGHNPLFHWVRDHRVHHKFSETDADPHNSKRGFFFAHMGWLMMKKHPEVVRKGNLVDMSDIAQDPVIKFHMKYYALLVLLICFVIPIIVPPLCWGQDWTSSFQACMLRYVIVLHCTWFVNSAAHLWGYRPYDKEIGPTENLAVSIFSVGEGWHNYHHRFPWDYKAAELGGSTVNVTTFVIDMFAKLGWAYDRKCASEELIRRSLAKGDGSHPAWRNTNLLEKEPSKTKNT